MTTSNHTSNPWNGDSYGTITGSGARKLASSRIAPLVALARGYWEVADKESATAFATLYRGAAGVQSLKTSLIRLVAPEEEDLLAMPWFSAKSVYDDGSAARATTYQYRPATPVINAEGKQAKYMFFPGQNMVIDAHPATPVEWFEDAKSVLVTEGLLKGDSALTAQLLASAVTVDELSKIYGPDGAPLSTTEARSALQALMLRVPPQLRTVIANSASVTTWQGKDADWRKVGLRGKRVIVAFDGDLAENAMVWRETEKMFKFARSEKGEPTLLNLFGPEVALAMVNAGIDTSEKLGIDDYFDKIGTWDTLLELQVAALPPKPQGIETNAVAGDFRVHPSNDAIVEEYVENISPNGTTSAKWVVRSRVGGRLLSHVASRRPTQGEISDGVVDPDQQMLLADASCVIEIALLDRNQDMEDEPTRYQVIGPSTLMSTPPQDWVRHAVQLPNEVLAHPDWPPRKGLDWLGAVKANKRDQVENAVAWNTMGWVPVPGGQPAFIIGNQVLAANEADQKQTRVGVTERVLPGSSKFGVIDEFPNLTLDEYKALVAADIKKVLRVFVENGFWTNRAIAVAVLCAMYRPTIPKHPGTTLYFVGPKGHGKSYTAHFMMAPWQQKPGTWTAKSLPGSASDTFAAHENSISLAPIWIIDDLAPQSDRRKSDQQASDLEAVIRAMFNNSAKRRMDGRTMDQREVANPIAMLAVTAENPPTVPSIQERTLTFHLPKGSFNDTADGGPEERWREKELLALVNKDGAAARLAAAMIRFWLLEDTGYGNTWADRQTSLEAAFEAQSKVATEVLQEEHEIAPGDAQRFVGQVSSLGLTLKVMYQLAKWAGVKDKNLLRLLGNENGYMRELYGLAAEGIVRSKGTTPGTALLKALGGLLATGKAHLRNPTTPGAPPFTVRDGKEDVGGVDVAALNQSLGWEFDARQSTWVPKGSSIGYFGTKDGVQIALFDTSAAFKEAQRLYPEIIPFGQSSTQSWSSVYSEELAWGVANRKESVATRTSLGSTDPGTSGTARHSGVPVLAEKMFEIVNGLEID
jgi:hypothetical protein